MIQPEVFPKVFRSGSRGTVRFRRLPPYFIAEPERIRIQYIGADRRGQKRQLIADGEYEEVPFRVEDGELRVELMFHGEQEHYLRLVEHTPGGAVFDRHRFSVASVEEDLFALRPWKGDFHMHSYGSDGEKAPADVPGFCRLRGFDFMALSDHEKYEPSLEAIAASAPFDCDLRCYPGEEIHLNNRLKINPHVINFGGRCGVMRFASEHRAEFEALVDAIAASLPPGLDEFNRLQVAYTEAAFRKIRDFGGVAVYCHPYWRVGGDRFYVTPETQETLLARGNFDAVEVISGYSRPAMEENQLSAARFADLRAQGCKIAVVGVSDAHGYEEDHPYYPWFAWYYTIVFAETPEFAELAAGIRARRSVAVEAVQGEFPRIYGEFRFVKYAYFLLREVLPEHDRLCRTEGELLLRALHGDVAAAAALKLLKGSVAALYRKLWQPPERQRF